jgi:hypothetical protein
MSAIFWVMGALSVGTFLPSIFFTLLYGVTGEDGCLRRARSLFNWAKLFALLGFTIGIWGHVVVALWRLFFA